MRKRVADIVVETLMEYGIDMCFSVVGGGSMHLNNAFALCGGMRKIYNHHEQACAMAAEAYARYSGRPAAVCVTSGPGGLNAVNGVQGAWVDSIPMVVVSGHPRQDTTVAATGLDIRCRGVQENPIVRQVQTFTKYARQITDPYEVRRELARAIHAAMEGRRGPVWLDFPLDVQGSHIDEDGLYPIPDDWAGAADIRDDIQELEGMLAMASRPCILTGSGIRSGDAYSSFREFMERVRVPVVGGALQADICFQGQEGYYGMSGSIGPRCGNFILQNADFILALGNSLSFKQTGYAQEKFAPNAKIVMVDAQGDEAKKPGLHVDKCICSDLDEFFRCAGQTMGSVTAPGEWVRYCDMVRDHFRPFEMLVREGPLKADGLVPQLYWWEQMMQNSKEDAIFALGNSQGILGLLQEGIRHDGQRVLVNYNSGSMGDDLPNAIGAAAASGREVICVTGDGSVMMNLQELQTIRHYGLPIKVVILSNHGYGAIRNTCNSFFDGVMMGCDEGSGISFPDFQSVAHAFGFPYRACKSVGEVAECVRWLNEQGGYCVLEVSQRIDDIYGPRLSSVLRQDGTFETPALHQMTPLLPEGELAGLMLGD